MKLSDFELDVMQLFWERGPGSSPEIHTLIHDERPVSYSTVKTIIDRLEDKGALYRVRQEGRTIIYDAAVQREVMSKSLLPVFLKRLFSGEPRQLMAQLIEEEPLDRSDIEYLQRMLEAKRVDEVEG